ncbi:TPA_exp: putative MFS transporter [Trichophyton benhamiae CBS 112371]|nr:TPA_exp: putative MFS transporter [Trichophyton benhamiae CBS 112371]
MNAEIELRTQELPQESRHEGVMEAKKATRIAAAAFCFLVAGVNDGSLGALVPYLLRSYGLSSSAVGLIWGLSFVGWLLAALTGSWMRSATGLGGALVAGAAAQLLAHLLRFWTPPFALFAVTFVFAALGQGYQDAQANVFVAGLQGAHRWLGLIHASYSAGCLVGPLLAALVATHTDEWMYFYLVPGGLGLLNLLLAWWAFKEHVCISISWSSNTSPINDNDTNADSTTSTWTEMKLTLQCRPVWLLSLFYFFYLGVAITVGGWLVEYLVQERKGDLSRVGYVPTGYFGGIMLGRLLLAEPAHRLGEKPVILVCSLCCLALQIVFWRVNNIIADSVVVSVFGFLSGPFFASGMSVASKLIPTHIHTAALGLIFVVAQAGGTVFPAVTGAIASKAGVSVLQPILVGLIALMGLSWAFVPSVDRKRD